MHDLVHVVVLRHGVILLVQPLVIKLHQLGVAALGEALKDVVTVAGRLRDRAHPIVCASEGETLQARQIRNLRNLSELFDRVVRHVQIL